MYWLILICSVMYMPTPAMAQIIPLPATEEGPRPPQFEPVPEYPVALTFFAPLFLPKLLQDVYQLKEYIRSEEFKQLCGRYGDLYGVDALYHQALRLSWKNVYETLLICFIGTLDHRKFGVRLPVIGPLLWFPLTSEFEDEFLRRQQSLPRKFYHDSNTTTSGDRDKLQHFFGSAFLAYAFESPGAAERVGGFVEWGEDQFIVDGVLDDRDIRANYHGQEFGRRLMQDPTLLPSDVLAHERTIRESTTPEDP